MNIKSIYTLAAGLLAMTIALTSCHSSKQSAKQPKNSPVSEAISSGTQNVEPQQEEARWHDVYMPVRVSLRSPMSLSLSGRATLVRDSAIHISLRFLGIVEVAEINITTDSVFMVDKHHKYLFAEPLQKVLGKHQLTIGQMQDIMLGTALGEASELTFNNPGSDKPVTVAFSGYTASPAGNIARQVTVSAPVNRYNVNASLEWSVDKARWDTGRTVNFTPPAGYRRVTLDNALEMLRGIE